MRRILLYLVPVLLMLLIVPAMALAQAVIPGPGDVAPQPDGPVATGFNLWLVVIGAGTRFVMYFINHHVPFLRTEPQKQISVAVAGAVAGALYQAIFDGNFGANDATLNAVVQAIAFTLAAHNLLFKPGELNVKFGGGRNANEDLRP